MRARRWLMWELERERHEMPLWPFYWFAPLSQVEAVILEALRVRRNVVR
ncbi:hypothetical protein NUH88_21825 [Nisaea acidiphila]|uniref:Uncharacterized protein n=1 Tax=Nisaea acidiphila TaxID=1862145 RepID=A0A9J7ARY2_9PROT|nr:hypothetical protein [Nisaea acidiphila]UUX50015.1 hypothetical protein NUH88_21825 [Nisaea acidiphila]